MQNIPNWPSKVPEVNVLLAEVKRITENVTFPSFLLFFRVWVVQITRYVDREWNGIGTYNIHHNLNQHARSWKKWDFLMALFVTRTMYCSYRATHGTAWMSLTYNQIRKWCQASYRLLCYSCFVSWSDKIYTFVQGGVRVCRNSTKIYWR